MTLTGTARKILEASQAGSLDDAEPALRRLQDMIVSGVKPDEIPGALAILGDARTAMHGHRTRMMLDLKELENSSCYTRGAENLAASWEMDG